MKKYFVNLIISVLFITACNFNSTYLNEESEKEQAEKVISQFHSEIVKKKFDDAETLFSKEFVKTTGSKKLLSVFLRTDSILGNFNSSKLVDWKTQRVVGSNPSTHYLLVFESKYKKFNAIETFSLIRENDTVKILGYNVNSDGFFK